jgi:hypothetical protein
MYEEQSAGDEVVTRPTKDKCASLGEPHIVEAGNSEGWEAVARITGRGDLDNLVAAGSPIRRGLPVFFERKSLFSVARNEDELRRSPSQPSLSVSSQSALPPWRRKTAMAFRPRLIPPGLALASLMVVAGPAAAATGLTESVYHDITAVGGQATQTDLDNEIADIASSTPAYSFTNTATTFNYNYNTGFSVADFLGADGAGIAAVQSDTNPGNPGVNLTAITALGTINVSTPGLYTLSLPLADDAASVSLGGATVIEQNFQNGLALTSPSTATVDITGPESFELFYYNLGGNADLDFTVSGPGVVSYDTGVLSGVPEPASWALMMLGLGAVGAGLRLQRQRRSLPASELSGPDVLAPI